MKYKNEDTKKVIYTAGIMISMILCCIFYYLGATYQKIDTLEITEKPAIGYRVNLKENAYFLTPEAGKTERYIGSMIKGINIDFDYLSKTATKGESKYKYTIETELIITDKNDIAHTLWSKNEKLKEKENSSKENVKFSDSILIDYQKYDNLVKSFNQSYSLQTTANLYVRCKVDVDGKYDSLKENINYQNEMVVQIPLNETTILITPSVKNDNTRVIESVVEGLQFEEITYYVLTIIFFLGTLCCVTKRVEVFYQQYKTETTYERNLRKILKDYDDIIVMSQNKPYVATKNIIKVTSFEELLDAQSELREPIIFYEKNSRATFIIASETAAYEYILEKDGESKKKNEK